MELYTPIHNAIIRIKIIAFNFYYTIEAFDYFTLCTKLVYKNVFSRQERKKCSFILISTLYNI